MAPRVSRFTFDAEIDRVPIWSPDGGRIAFGSNRNGVENLYEKLASGDAPETVLMESADAAVPLDYSPDGRYLLYASVNRTAGDTDLWVRPMDGDTQPWIFLKTPFTEAWRRSSPDGRWVAYTSNESGRPEVYIRPFAPSGRSGDATSPAGGQSQVSADGGVAPTWSSDGPEVYYIAPTGEMMAVPITTRGTTLELGTPVALFRTRMFGGGVDAAAWPAIRRYP
jgi:Tol biopolymer transport system component